MKIPEDEWQRTNPGCERNGSSTAERFESNMHQTTRAAQQTAWQERIGCAPALQKSKKRISKQYDCAHHCERELKAGREKFVRIPAEKKERRRSETVEHKNFSVEKEAA